MRIGSVGKGSPVVGTASASRRRVAGVGGIEEMGGYVGLDGLAAQDQRTWTCFKLQRAVSSLVSGFDGASRPVAVEAAFGDMLVVLHNS